MARPLLMLAVLALALLGSPLATHATGASRPILVIVGKRAVINSLSRDDLRLIFQTKRKYWPDGSTVIPFNLPPEAPVRRAFDSAVLGLEPNLVAHYWIDRRVRGGDRPPNTAPSSAMLVKIVNALPGAIGYVDAESIDASVKVVARVIDGQVLAP